MLFASLLTRVVQDEVSRSHILTDGQFTVTYADLPGLLSTILTYIQSQGVRRNGCLAVECPNTLPGALTLLALLQQGLNFVLLPPVAHEEHGAVWKPLPHFCQTHLVIGRSPADADAAWLQAPENFLALTPNPGYMPPADPELHAPGYLFLRTSGSMGASKLVVHTQANLIANAQGCVERYGYTNVDRMTIPVPIAHMYGLGVGFLPAILAGAAIDLQDQTNLFRYLAHEKRFAPTVTCVTPTLATMLLKGFKTPRAYRLAVTATQRINEATFRAFDAAIGGCFVNQYGSSEMGAIAVCDPDDDLDLKATSIGRPFPGVHLSLDPAQAKSTCCEDKRAAETGIDVELGELYCRHSAGFIGYVDETGAWLQRQAPGSWYRTADLARRLPAGNWQITGRAGNSMNRRGYLVHFAEIERLMEQIAGLEHVVVVGQEETERITAFCVSAPPATLSAGQVRSQCFDLLPSYAVPDEVKLLDRLPLLASGKVDRQQLLTMNR